MIELENEHFQKMDIRPPMSMSTFEAESVYFAGGGRNGTQNDESGDFDPFAENAA